MFLGSNPTVIDLINAINKNTENISIQSNSVNQISSKIAEFSLAPTPTDIPITTTSGVSYNLTSFVHKENFVNNFEGELSLEKTVRNSSGVVISTTPLMTTPVSETSVEISLKDNNTVVEEQSITYTLSGIGKSGEVIKSEQTIYFYFPHYVGIRELPGINMSVIRSLEQVNTRSLAGYRKIVVEPYTYDDGTRSVSQYIWIVTPKPISDVTCNGISVDLTSGDCIHSTNGGRYYWYRSEDEILVGEYNFNIIV